jgi:hypothetical protein
MITRICAVGVMFVLLTVGLARRADAPVAGAE